MSVLNKIGNDSWKRPVQQEVERYPEQLSLHLNNTIDATPEEFEEWREKDFFSKGYLQTRGEEQEEYVPNEVHN